jgi:hypothetical protein
MTKEHYLHSLLADLTGGDSIERREEERRGVTLSVEKDRRACPCGLCEAKPERRFYIAADDAFDI